MANGNFGGGAGIPLNPYLIEDVADFKAIDGSNLHYKLASNLDFSGSPNTFISRFDGVLDGDNKKLLNHTCTIASPTYTTTAYFIYNNYGIIKNLIIENFAVNLPNTALERVSCFILQNSSNLENIKAYNCTMNVKARTYSSMIGGLVAQHQYTGDNVTSIYNCGFEGTISATTSNSNLSYGGYCGLLVGNSSAPIYYSYSKGNLFAPNGYCVGGLVGTQYSSTSKREIVNCYSHANVTGYASVGGFIGESTTLVENCYSSGVVHGIGNCGGFVGSVQYLTVAPNNSMSIKNCFSLAPYLVKRLGSSSTNFGDFAGVVGSSIPASQKINWIANDSMTVRGE